MGVYDLKPAFSRKLEPVMRFATRFHPNTVSAFATACSLLAALLLVLAPSTDWLYLLVPPFLFLRIVFNVLDGKVALRRGMQCRTGEMVNEFSDRLNDTIIFGGLALSGVIAPAWVLSALVAMLLVSCLGILAKAAGGSRRFDGPLGKPERMIILGLASIAAFFAPRAGWTAWQGLHGVEAVFLLATWLILVLAVPTLLIRWVRAWREQGPGE